jgi:hypothetical protein
VQQELYDALRAALRTRIVALILLIQYPQVSARRVLWLCLSLEPLSP